MTLGAFREMELFLPVRFEHRFEAGWIQWDHLLLSEWHGRSMIESFGSLIPFWLELCYLLVYGIGFFCVALLYLQHRRVADRSISDGLSDWEPCWRMLCFRISRPSHRALCFQVLINL